MNIEQFKSIPVVYIAGPYRAANSWEIEQNIRNAETVALDVLRRGAAAICPHTNNRFFFGAIPEDLALDTDMAVLLRCDAVMTTPLWRQSVGATHEVVIAEESVIPVFHDLDILSRWIAAWKNNRQTTRREFITIQGQECEYDGCTRDRLYGSRWCIEHGCAHPEIPKL